MKIISKTILDRCLLGRVRACPERSVGMTKKYAKIWLDNGGGTTARLVPGAVT